MARSSGTSQTVALLYDILSTTSFKISFSETPAHLELRHRFQKRTSGPEAKTPLCLLASDGLIPENFISYYIPKSFRQLMCWAAEPGSPQSFQSVSAEWHAPMPRIELLHLPRNVGVSLRHSLPCLDAFPTVRKPRGPAFPVATTKPPRQRHGFRELYESTGGGDRDRHPAARSSSSRSFRLSQLMQNGPPPPARRIRLESSPQFLRLVSRDMRSGQKRLRKDVDMRFAYRDQRFIPFHLGEVLFGFVLLPSGATLLSIMALVTLRPSASSAASTRFCVCRPSSVTPVERRTILVDTVIWVLFALHTFALHVQYADSSKPRKFHRLRSIAFSFGNRLPHSLVTSLCRLADSSLLPAPPPPMVILPTIIGSSSFDAGSRHLFPFPAYSTPGPFTASHIHPCTTDSTHSINLKRVASFASPSVSTTRATHLRRQGGAGEGQ
ncbi:hypothetical protein C8F01DRAFT_1274607 [Mycena amicta]|nr:hypothetical protein C8F01DRAFT_1274607 [Mycena amicta]